ncbi:hypothetical protein [Streptomyces sp. YIM S03343]
MLRGAEGGGDPGTEAAADEQHPDLADVDGQAVNDLPDDPRQAPAADGIEELLDWAEQCDDRSQHLAAQARAALAGLAELRGNATAIEHAKAKVAALETELARARVELRAAMNNEGSDAPAVPARGSSRSTRRAA